MDIINQYNKFASSGNNLIKKALTSATGVGEALIPQKLEKMITNTLTYLMPEMAILNPEFDNQKTHEFNRLTALPGPGGAMGEGAVTPTRNAQYARDSVTMKVIRRKGAVTNFLKDSSQKYIDAAAVEMENHIYAHALDLAFYNYFGNEIANPYEHGGLDRFINTSYNRKNEAVGGVVPTTLAFLDKMIDKNTRKQGAPHQKAFIMSPEMLSKVSSLLTNVRLNQGLQGGGLTEVEIPGGWRLNAYRNIPIIETTFTRPQTSMGTVTPTTATTGGTISASTYYFRVSKVTYFGEQLACAEISQATTGSTSTVTLTWTAETDALQYRIYAGTASGSLKLVKILSAFQYNGVGTIIGETTSRVFTANPTTAGAEVVGEMSNDVPLVATGGIPPEMVLLWDLDKIQGLGKYAYTNTGGAKFKGLVTVEELAKTDDDLPFLIKTYGALVPSFQDTSQMHRGLRVE